MRISASRPCGDLAHLPLPHIWQISIKRILGISLWKTRSGLLAGPTGIEIRRSSDRVIKNTSKINSTTSVVLLTTQSKQWLLMPKLHSQRDSRLIRANGLTSLMRMVLSQRLSWLTLDWLRRCRLRCISVSGTTLAHRLKLCNQFSRWVLALLPKLS